MIAIGFLGPLVGSLAAGAISKVFSGGGKSKREKKARKAFDEEIASERERGSRFSDEYEERALNYNPQDALRTSVQGTWDYLLPKMRDQEVSLGRLRTGFAAADEQDQLANLIASKALDTEQLNFANMRDIGGYGERSRDRTLDALFGTYATERQAREQAAASKRGMWGNIIGAGLGAAGRVLASRGG